VAIYRQNFEEGHSGVYTKSYIQVSIIQNNISQLVLKKAKSKGATRGNVNVLVGGQNGALLSVILIKIATVFFLVISVR
jgi:hypothetical protein